jgi:hypothetical protein
MNKEVTRYDHPMQAPVAYSFDQIQRMAASFAKSGLFGVKDADSAFSLMMYAQATGKHPGAIMMDYDLINNRLAKKASAVLRDFQASGGRVDWKKYDDEGCIGIFSHPLSNTPITVDWNMERAKKAGLAGKNGDMYGKYTRQMFRSRCISEGVRTIAPEATENMYTPEEIRTITEDELPEPVSIQQAATSAAAQVTQEIPEEELDAMVGTLDVRTLPELVSAFGKAYTVAKTKGDERAMKKLKSNYDSMKEMIEAEPTI